MTEDMFRAILDTAQVKPESDGWHALPEGRLLTLYSAHNGVGLTVGKIDRVRHAKATVLARNQKGETFVLALDDVFAAAVDGPANAGGSRKAGFLG